VTPAQRGQVLTFIRTRLEQEVGLRAPRLYAVSALVGLRAKLTGSARELVDSGLSSLENTLIEFLTTHKSAESLRHMCDRTLMLLAEADPEVLQGERVSALQGLLGRLKRMRDHLAGNLGQVEGCLRPAREATKSRPEAELMEAVRRSCQICARVADAMMKFMAKFQYKIIVNQNERSALASRGGLCPLHTWQYAEIASPQGISLAFPAVLNAASRRLRDLIEADSVASLGRQVGDFVPGPEKCRACQEQASTEEGEDQQASGTGGLWKRTGREEAARPLLAPPECGTSEECRFQLGTDTC